MFIRMLYNSADRSGNSNGDGTSGMLIMTFSSHLSIPIFYYTVATISLRRITLLFLCSQALLAITEL